MVGQLLCDFNFIWLYGNLLQNSPLLYGSRHVFYAFRYLNYFSATGLFETVVFVEYAKKNQKNKQQQHEDQTKGKNVMLFLGLLTLVLGPNWEIFSKQRGKWEQNARNLHTHK